MKSKRIEAWNFDSAQVDVINRFCANNLQVLRSIVDPILKRFYDIDRDEAYGLAMEIMMQCVEDYDQERGAKLNTYFRRIFARAVIDWYRDGHTYEKCNFETEFKDGKRLRVKDEENKKPIRKYDFSLDAPMSETQVVLVEKVFFDKGFEDDIVEDKVMPKEIKAYLDNLSSKQRAVAELIMDGYRQNDIISTLHMTKAEYLDCLSAMKAYRNMSILFPIL